ncbi:MAG TPA: F0F1 ATP synthase subunit epsilon [Acidimicrobiales bacterium]|nr:F0F1 ATP synthase subunit epsilon [Acidimicrobiales bacterium]
MALHVDLVSPERLLYSGEADMVIARTVGGGDIAFLAGHSPFIGALDIATVTIRTERGQDEIAAVHGGFVDVSDDRVTILSDVAEMADQIDVDRARRARDDAERRAAQGDDVEAEAEVRRAHVRLLAAGGPPAA